MKATTVGIVLVSVIGVACAAGGIALLALRDRDPAPRHAQSQASVPVRTEAPASETDEATLVIDPLWVANVAEAAEIPERAMTAYAAAAYSTETALPGCGIGWNTLAAIGSVESLHGSINGAVLGDDGIARPAILGPALDGTQFDAILDTDGGALDGDTEWDRAVGPMQFLPETWSFYGRDGNGDGIADPNQIDDATLGTAAMLCDVGGDLTVAENWIAAVDAYNPNLAYNNDVADAADRFAAAASATE